MRELGLFGSYNRSEFKHLLKGVWRETPYRLVQANLRRRSSGGKNTSGSSSKVFQGLLFEIDVPVAAPGRILIVREYGSSGNKLAGLVAFGNGRRMPRLAFDHPAFEDVFEVHAANPDAAHRFMPPDLLDALIAIGDHEGGKSGARSMVAGLEGDRFYLALDRGLGFMEVGTIGRSVHNIEESLHELFDDLELTRRIIDRLHGLEGVATSWPLGHLAMAQIESSAAADPGPDLSD